MKTPLFLGAFAALLFSPFAQAQTISEPIMMSVTHEEFDGDLLAAPGTVLTLGDVNAATVSGNPLGLANITLIQNPLSAIGVSSTNIYGRALALDPAYTGNMMSVDLGGSFEPFDANIELGGPSTEIGFAIQDWIGPMILDFYSNGSLVATHTSQTIQNPGVEFWLYFQMTGGDFDRVDMRASTTAGNWAIAGMKIETTGPLGPALALSCGGGTATADISNCTPGGPIAVVYGPAGAYVHGGAQCNGLTIDLIPAAQPLVLSADGSGAASLTRPVGPGACGSGVLVQAADIVTCVATNSEAL